MCTCNYFCLFIILKKWENLKMHEEPRNLQSLYLHLAKEALGA